MIPNIEIKIDRNTIDQGIEILKENLIQSPTNFKTELDKKYQRLVRIIDDETKLEKEDLVRKYARDYTFWLFELRYYQEEKKQNLELKKYILEKKRESVQRIQDKFDPKMVAEIYEKVDEYKWKDENYGEGSRRKYEPPYADQKHNRVEINPDYPKLHLQ